MRTIEGLAVAPKMRDRKLKALAAQEFQTTIVGMMGHDLRQSLQVIQGTYSLLRSRLEEMPQQAWLDRGERAVAKLTEQLNCLVDAFYLAGTRQCPGGLLGRTWASVLAAPARKRRCRYSKWHRSSGDFNECPCREQSRAARLHPPQSVDQCHKIHRAWRAHSDRLPPQRTAKSGSMYTTRASAFRKTNCRESSNPSRALRPNAATVWASGSRSFVARSRCSATGSKSGRLWVKGRCSRSTRRLAAPGAS